MNKKRALIWVSSLVLSVVFALVFYAFNTPLGPSIGSDNAIYLTMGTAISNGYAPYTEIFDHKGPLLFVIQAIPQILSGGYSTLAVFVQQVLFLFACMLLLARMADMIHAPALVLQAAYLALISSLTGGGNLTEEYTNVFTLLGLIQVLHVFGASQRPKRLFLRACLLGAMSALCFLVRANNALVLCAVTLALALCMAISKEWKALLICAGGFLTGLVIAALPVVLWLAAHDALEASFYGSIIHNMMYTDTGDTSRVYMLLHSGYGRMAILMALLACAGALTVVFSNLPLAFAMAAGAAAAGLAAFLSHKFYQHYLVLGAPMAVIGVGYLCSWAAKRSRKAGSAFAALIMMVCLVWLGMQGAETNRWRLSEREGIEQYVQDAQELYDQVPESDRDRFLAYRVEPKWYAATGALPCMRFYFLQEILADADPAVMDEIVAEFETEPPLWAVIFYDRPFSPPYDKRVQEIFDTRYEFVDARGQYQLLKLKETP